MPAFSVFRWLDGRGWLILAGGPNDDVRASALARMAADGAVACIAVDGGAAEADVALDDITDLGAPSGFIVDIASDDDDTVRDRVGQAGFVLVTDAYGARSTVSLLAGAAVEAIQEAYGNGAVVLLEGSAAAAFGSVLLDDESQSGFNWLQQSIVLTGDDLAYETAMRQSLLALGDHVSVQIGRDSAVAFGGDGQVEIWGEGDVKVVLGAAFTQMKE